MGKPTILTLNLKAFGLLDLTVEIGVHSGNSSAGYSVIKQRDCGPNIHCHC